MYTKHKKNKHEDKDTTREKKSLEQSTDESTEQIRPEDTVTAEQEQKADSTADAAEDCREKLAALNDKYIRLLAEYDNYRRRAAREMLELSKTANEEIMKEFLPILDNLDRATEHKKR